jgi:hypothetical protein
MSGTKNKTLPGIKNHKVFEEVCKDTDEALSEKSLKEIDIISTNPVERVVWD